MGKINRLDKSVYNRLSAGEVVENPASIVKELVENSIDAGAMHINVRIEDGGIKSISVTDDGCGIEKDDLPMAIMPHATSKISTADDLETVSTLGFRGEALASIASVSQMEIRSKFIMSDIANFLTVKAGEIIDSGECAFALGTCITVSSLFFNTPARYKFLKPAKGEENNVTHLMAELIIANPDVAFKYVVDDETVYYTNGSGMDNVMLTVFGENIYDNLIQFTTSEKNYTVKGYIGRPSSDAVIGNKSKQVYVVNGRTFEDITLPAALQNAYGERLMKRTFPVAVIDIVMPFDLVDVNVHPNKKEVRFAEKRILIGIVYSAVKAALEKDERERNEEINRQMTLSSDSKQKLSQTLQKVLDISEKNMESDGYVTVSDNISKLRELVNKYTITEVKEEHKIDDIPLRSVKNEDLLKDLPPYVAAQIEANPFKNVISFADDFKPAYKDNEEENLYQETIAQLDMRESEIGNEKPQYRVVGQIFDTYLVVEVGGNKLFFIDQHAAHERILYDNFLANTKKQLEVQSYFIPFVKDITDSEAEIIEKNAKNLAKLGFDIKVFSDKVEIYSIPCLLIDIDLDEFLHSIVNNYGEIDSLTEFEDIKAKFAKIACHSAIKGGEKLDESQIEYIMDYFMANGMPLQCPHGRPTVVQFSKSDVEKWFRRIV